MHFPQNIFLIFDLKCHKIDLVRKGHKKKLLFCKTSKTYLSRIRIRSDSVFFGSSGSEKNGPDPQHCSVGVVRGRVGGYRVDQQFIAYVLFTSYPQHSNLYASKVELNLFFISFINTVSFLFPPRLFKDNICKSLRVTSRGHRIIKKIKKSLKYEKYYYVHYVHNFWGCVQPWLGRQQP